MLAACFLVVNEYVQTSIPINKHMYFLVEFFTCLLALAYSMVIAIQVRNCRLLAYKNA